MLTDIILNNLIAYVFGSYLFLALFVMFGFIVSLAVARVNVLLGLAIGAPMFISLFINGWFGGFGWIKNLIVLVMGLIWAFVLWRVIE